MGEAETSVAREGVIGQRLVGVKIQAERDQAPNTDAHILAWPQGPAPEKRHQVSGKWMLLESILGEKGGRTKSTMLSSHHNTVTQEAPYTMSTGLALGNSEPEGRGWCTMLARE